MFRGVLKFFLLILAIFAPFEESQAARRFILHCPPASFDRISRTFGLTLLAQVTGHDVFLVSALDLLPPYQFANEVKSDSDVVDFKVEGSHVIPEVQGLRLASDPPVPGGLSTPSAAVYFGNPVLASYLTQPAVGLIRLFNAQTAFGATGSGVVAVIDTGVDPTHPVLKSSLISGYDFTRNVAGIPSELADLSQSTAVILDQSTAVILDKNQVLRLNQSTAVILDQSTAVILDPKQLPPAFGHGTMVAGLVHLAAPTARIMPLKAFRADGVANEFDVIRAIYFAADNGAKVINMSFSITEASSELMRALNFATGRGVLSIASAGNTAKETLVYPAGFKNVLGVASTNNADQRSSFSNFGPAVSDLAAPGEALITTFPGKNFAAAWGTSFATPLVSGTTSLLVQFKPGLQQSDAEESLSKAVPISNDLGLGRLDVYSAVQFSVRR